MNILCISPIFSPMADSEAYCAAKMGIALHDHGANVTVLSMGLSHPTTGNKVDDSKLWREASKMIIEVTVPSTHRSLASLWLGIRFQTVAYARWVGALVERARELHSEKSFDIVYSRSLPMVAHIAGYWVSRSIGRPWVANINDPWDYHLFPNGKYRKVSRVEAAFSMHWLKKTLRYADLITYPSSRLRNFTSRLGREEPRGEVIPHIGYACRDQEPEDGFCLVHAGKLGVSDLTGRPTRALLRGLAIFLKGEEAARPVTRFTLVGPKDNETEALVEELDLGSVVRTLGRVNYEESIRHIRLATVCVLVEADCGEGIYLPSKLADYIVAKKPILALSPSVGVLSDMVKHGGIIRVSPNDEKSIAEAIGKLYKTFQNGRIHEYTPPEELLGCFEEGAVAKKFIAAVSKIRGKRVRNRSACQNASLIGTGDKY